MAHSIDLDPAPVPITPTPVGPGGALQYMRSLLQMQILANLQTGNPLVDAVITSVAFSVITMMMSHFEEFLTWMKNTVVWLVKSVWRFLVSAPQRVYHWITRRNYIKTIDKTAEIDYITDDKKINELYKAVHWYLSNSEEIDFLLESPLKLTFEKKINADTAKKLTDEPINKHISKNKSKELEYKKHKISYSMSDHLINVYTDRERKRENYRITLNTKMNEKENIDILEDFCQFCLSEYMKNMTSSVWSQMIYINDGPKWKSMPSKNRRKIDTVVLKDGLKEEIKKDLQIFLNSEEWYQHRDIPYTRGYLFYGLPGTGKTSLIKGLSNVCKRHIHFLMLNTVKSDAELLELFREIDYKTTILVIEDIDCMSEISKSRELKEREKEARRLAEDSLLLSEESDDENDRLKRKIRKLERKMEKQEKQEKHLDQAMTDPADQPAYKKNEYGTENSAADSGKLTLSGLLNAVDGVFNNEGRILIMTTNHPEVLDDALIRPGRVDRKFLFDYCNRSQIKGLYEMFFNEPCLDEDLEYVTERMYSPAHITSLFMRYRDHPREGLRNIDEEEDKPIIAPIVTIDQLPDSPEAPIDPVMVPLGAIMMAKS